VSDQLYNEIVSESRAPGFMDRPFEAIEQLATRLAKVHREVSRPSLKIHVLSSFLTDYLIDFLRLMLARRGIVASISAPGYGQMIGEVLTRPSELAAFDVVVLLPTYRDLRFVPEFGVSKEQALKAVNDEVAFWCDLLERISAPVAMLSFDLPPHRILADGDGWIPGGLTRHVRSVNLGLADAVSGNVALIDSEALCAELGASSCDLRLYYLCKQPYSMEALPRIADAMSAGITGLLGRGKKVLVLDLDNTLWGGIVGDVGIEGLTLGPETAEGEAYASFQRYLQQLSRRGVILAVCSKNHDHIAREAFGKNPAMVLTEKDIACFVANFEDKASNIRRIAATLNVGLDALVFVDDNPVERQWVARELPEVLVVDLPEYPAGYADAVDAAKMFPLYRLTSEDLQRAVSYKAVAQIADAAKTAEDMDDFLQDLQPIVHIEEVQGPVIDRVVQLIGKTNQFKLNPTLFTHTEVKAIAKDVLALRMADRLQDYGIVAIAVTAPDANCLVVRNWVMSCRVFSRRLENVMRQVLADLALAQGLSKIVLPFVPSKKNGLVPETLERLGFADCGNGHFIGPALPSVDINPHYMTIHDLRTSGREVSVRQKVSDAAIA
jgi:FkbH-like protein